MNKTMTRKERNRMFWERNRKSGGHLLRKTLSAYGYKLVRALMLFGLCFMILQPILNKISISFMAEEDLYNPMVIAIPEHFTAANYQLAAEFMDYGTAFTNTLIISLTIAILQIAMCTLVGYGFARFKFPLKNFWFACVILMIVIPPQTLSTSLYLHFRYFDVFGIIELITGETINLRGSVLPYYLMSAGCMGLKNGLYIYMIRQFFRGIPKELEEAAYVDGCGKVATFVKIMLPDAKPILTSCFLFAYVWQWTDSFYSNLFLRSDFALLSSKLSGVAGALDSYLDVRGIAKKATTAYSQGMIATGTLMVIFPLIILYLFAQKGFVESLSQSGIKM